MENWVRGGGYDIFQVAAHEIGHALGLSHSNEPLSLLNPYYSEAFEGLQADDIEAIQYLYGVSEVPVPAAFWLFIPSTLGLLGFRKKNNLRAKL